jgi:hypothetical protein
VFIVCVLIAKTSKKGRGIACARAVSLSKSMALLAAALFQLDQTNKNRGRVPLSLSLFSLSL